MGSAACQMLEKEGELQDKGMGNTPEETWRKPKTQQESTWPYQVLARTQSNWTPAVWWGWNEKHFDNFPKELNICLPYISGTLPWGPCPKEMFPLCGVTNTQNGCLIDQNDVFLTVLDDGKRDIKASWTHHFMKGSEMAPSLSPHGRRVSFPQNCFKNENNSIHKTPPSWPHHCLKAPSLYTTVLEARDSTYKVWRDSPFRTQQKNIHPCKYAYKDIHIGLICDIPKWEMTPISINRWVGRHILDYSDGRTQFGSQRSELLITSPTYVDLKISEQEMSD